MVISSSPPEYNFYAKTADALSFRLYLACAVLPDRDSSSGPKLCLYSTLRRFHPVQVVKKLTREDTAETWNPALRIRWSIHTKYRSRDVTFQFRNIFLRHSLLHVTISNAILDQHTREDLSDNVSTSWNFRSGEL